MKTIFMVMMALLTSVIQVNAHADTPASQQVQLKTRILDLDRTKLRDLGFSFYVGTPIYNQGNDDLLLNWVRYAGGVIQNNSYPSHNTNFLNTKHRPGLTLGGAIHPDSERELQLNFTSWNHTDSQAFTFTPRVGQDATVNQFASAKLDYYSIDVLLGKKVLTTPLCGFTILGGFIYADAHRVYTRNNSGLSTAPPPYNNRVFTRTKDERYHGFGPMAEAKATMRPFVSMPQIVLEGDVRGGLLYSTRSYARTYNQSFGDFFNGATTVIVPYVPVTWVSNDAHSNSAYVRFQAAVFYEKPVNGKVVRIGGGWQTRQYQNAFTTIDIQNNEGLPLVSGNNLDLTGPFIKLIVTPSVEE
jgi:Legionella pneumophila major outer membrane protein precursor